VVAGLFQIEDRHVKGVAGGSLLWQARPNINKARILGKFVQERLCEDRDMLTLAENEVLESPAKAASLRRPVSEPLMQSIAHGTHGVVTMRTTHADHATRAEATEHVMEMEMQIGKMREHVVRVDRIQRSIWEGKSVSQIGPHVGS